MKRLVIEIVNWMNIRVRPIEVHILEIVGKHGGRV
jgi:hypothetical protein